MFYFCGCELPGLTCFGCFDLLSFNGTKLIFGCFDVFDDFSEV